ncbi:MAG: DUF3016 domain-containing protein [Lacunisphaera sp.]
MKKHLSLTSLVALGTILAAGCAAPSTSSTAATSYTSKNQAPSNVSVTFQNPDKFTDARSSFGGGTDDYYLDQLSAQFKKAAGRYLKDGQKLDLTVTDVDLAGDYVPRGGGINDVRIVKDIYRPRIAVTYKLTGADGKVLKQGDGAATDQFFMNNISVIGRDEPLFYDKAVIDAWARSEFGG